MAHDIRIPKLGMSVTEVTLIEWMFGDGETVEKGDVLYTLETDKTSTEIEAQESGVLRVTGEEGQTYNIGDVIGSIG
ncbi:biotin/lipoyl-containing protein [Blastomonas sp.]|uniref:biotin/lipoyl-containing protein n=1 Tax=Blastomonas sp. TaxID=1909299 RepID=UPI0035946509